MQQGDWDFYENRFLAYVLNGQGKDGKRFDDDFLVMTSGNACGSMDVRLPELPHKGEWKLVFDTSKNSSHKNDKKYQKGDVYTIEPHSVVVFTNQRSTQRENQKIRPIFNVKSGGR
jgi:hypothetical protein